MKTSRIIYALLVTLLLSINAWSQDTKETYEKRDPRRIAAELDGRNWFERNTVDDRIYEKLSNDDVFEIPASHLLYAIQKLENKSGAVTLSVKEAQRLLGNWYKCPEGKHPVLIRAVYCARVGGGGHEVMRMSETQIMVTQELYGHSSHPYLKTALIINVDFDISFVGCGVMFAG